MTCGFSNEWSCTRELTSTPAFSSAAARRSPGSERSDHLRTIEVADGRTLDVPTDVADLAFSYITLQHCESDDVRTSPPSPCGSCDPAAAWR